ncbi:TIGR01777 family oxidoreductase [Neptunomonas japonica]|uniref:Epimerase n=1 Tax=Neptunomonas japonica JAMM 1380 TaxID=1441457 RepID=A0A7R6PAG4_9GAMM|nr:TIGR01777 family oxidoreductase [Neptunomonas japonica]BBB30229.1 epimerase [Neptunomonas japonica JAMM 1380]
MHYLISGGTGFIGTALIHTLLEEGHQITVISRTPEKVALLFKGATQSVALTQVNKIAKKVDGVINLAGEPIVDKRWSEARKQLLRESRVDFTKELIAQLKRASARPEFFISGSAIGFYGSHEGGAPLHEGSHPISGFTHDLCRDWEAEALEAGKLLGARVCLVRTGVVLGVGGGALAKMLPPFNLGLGGPIGGGQQWMSWVHLSDEISVIRFLMEHQTLLGSFNATSPNAVTNEVFSQTLGGVLDKSAKLRMPEFVMKLLLGDASELLLEGQRVYPARLLDAGFEFTYPDLEVALQHSL